VDSPVSAEQLIATVNDIRAGDKAYVRVWRAEPSYAVQGEEMDSPPPSLALVIGGRLRLRKAATRRCGAGDGCGRKYGFGFERRFRLR